LLEAGSGGGRWKEEEGGMERARLPVGEMESDAAA
jgi:hypothetical protein